MRLVLFGVLNHRCDIVTRASFPTSSTSTPHEEGGVFNSAPNVENNEVHTSQQRPDLHRAHSEGSLSTAISSLQDLEARIQILDRFYGYGACAQTSSREARTTLKLQHFSRPVHVQSMISPSNSSRPSFRILVFPIRYAKSLRSTAAYKAGRSAFSEVGWGVVRWALCVENIQFRL